MSRLNHRTLYAITLREYDDQPPYNVTFKDNQGEQVTEKNIGSIDIRKRLDYDVTEFMLYYYRPEYGEPIGIGYTYVDYEQEYLNLEELVFTNNTTGEEYNLHEMKEIVIAESKRIEELQKKTREE